MKPELATFKATSIALIFWFVFSTLSVKSQEFDYKTTFADAEYYFLFNDAREALPLYQKLIDENYGNANIFYRLGRCYLCIPGVKHNAIEPLLKAVQNINPSYQEGSYKEEGAPIDALFYLGESYRIENQFDKAIEAYQQFRERLDKKDLYYLEYVEQQIQACNRAKEMMAKEKRLRCIPFPVGNSKAFVHGASISADKNHLVYTVKEKFYNALYVSQKDDNGKWLAPQNISLAVGLEGDLFSTAINSNGTEIFIFKNDDGIGNIYSSTKLDGQWQKAQKMGKPINSRFWETFASVSPDGQTVFFSSNRRGGAGGLDLYMSSRLPNGDWGEAQNLGASLNTPHNEEAPYLSPDGKRLFFISQGHNSLGGYDVFYSQRLENKEWSAPINLGYPISTPDDDMWYCPMSSDEGIVSLVERNQPNVSSLFVVSVLNKTLIDKVNIEGKLQLADNYEVQGKFFSVKLVDIKTNDTLQILNPQDISGDFNFVVSPGEYQILAMGNGYVPNSLSVAIPDDIDESRFGVNLKLKPLEVQVGKYIAIRSVLFDYDSYNLSSESVRELEKLYSYMYENPSVDLEISGHTDSKGSMEYNKALSLSRAKSVAEYLVERGIDSDRLSTRGVGFMESIAQNTFPDGTDNPAGRRLNRRASIRVLSSGQPIHIVDELDVPEHLKVRIQNYTILLAPVNQRVDDQKLQAVNSGLGIRSYRLTGRQNCFVYALGQFNHKSEALAALNYAIENGFPQASIVGEEDLKKLIY